MAEADGNRTRQRQNLPLNDFEDRAGHQTGYASLDHTTIMASRPRDVLPFELATAACDLPQLARSSLRTSSMNLMSSGFAPPPAKWP
jgi:hypothetical protein